MLGYRNRMILLFALLATRGAWAIAPPYIPDEQLAAFPIIVVAQWDKAPTIRHDRYIAANAIDRVEVHTTLNVLRVIKGSTELGPQPLLAGSGIAWNAEGTRIASGTSTYMPGDVTDITRPCLWFLKQGASWDATDRTDYLVISNYRAIQPLVLQKYFLALGSSTPSAQIPSLLTPEQPDVAIRVLHYICGGVWPWPYGPGEFIGKYENPSKRGKPLRAEAGRVSRLIDSNRADLRPRAAAVYAELEGETCMPRMRTLLSDSDPAVRGVAVGVLARHRDSASLPRIAQATNGIEDAALACKVIEALSCWGHEEVVPGLIPFLENDRFAYGCGDDLGIPALKARQALRRITGHWFSFDVAGSIRIWERARRIQDPARQEAFLRQALPDRESPLVAEVVGRPRFGPPRLDMNGQPESELSLVRADGSHPPVRDVLVTVRIRNVTSRPVAVTTQPSEVCLSWPVGSRSSGMHPYDQPAPTTGSVTIEPAGVQEYEIGLYEPFLLAEPTARTVRISYQMLAKGEGVSAWMGVLDVRFGSSWEERREAETVEQTWPNGNLRATGTMINGFRFGEWTFFNEEGDRIKVVDYGGVHGTAIYYPEAPENRGAGKRPQNE